jgi:DNA-binding transcriptional regulator YdaS (Cro superfamily)
MDGLDKAIKFFRTQSALAGALGLEPMAVTQWIKRKRIPPERAVQIEKATGGVVSRSELRPDLWPPQEAA